MRNSKIMKSSTMIISCGIIALISGCSTIESNDIVGAYKDNQPLGISTLDIKPNGTFSQILTTKSEKKYTAVGKWFFDATASSIQLDTGLSVNDDSGQPKVERIVLSYSVEKTIPEGLTQIVTDPDQGIAFIKIHPASSANR